MFYIVAFIGGLLTIVSPCILPVLPFVFSRAGTSFRRHGLPLLIGMAVTFAAVGSLAAVAGDWIVTANQYGRYLAMTVFAVVGVTLLWPRGGDVLALPMVRLGSAVERHGADRSTVGGSVLFGVSTGLLWTPCAGPILGLILTGVAVQGSGTQSALLLLAFAGGAVTALALALLAGGRVLETMTRAMGAEEWIRRGLGIAVLLGVIGIGLGWDTGVLARISLNGAGTATAFEQQLVDRVRPPDEAPAMQPSMMMMSSTAKPGQMSREMPPLDGAVQWLNGPPLTREGLRGKVVLFDFWTYSCINCLRAIPYVRAWAAKYKDAGLVVIGVHTPEFAFERDPDRVAKAARDLELTYPIAVDSHRTIWTAFNNRFWPAHYIVDAEGVIRHRHFGEGKYDETEAVIQSLLKEKNAPVEEGRTVQVNATGVEAAPDLAAIQSPETYIGYQRQESFASPQAVAKDAPARYTGPSKLEVNQWGLDGSWTVGEEHATLSGTPGTIVFRFHARDLHLVLGSSAAGTSVRFRVRVDGKPPLEDHGVDVDAQGNGTVTEHRLYQLIRQKGDIEDRTFEIEFLDPGVEAFAFTFG